MGWILETNEPMNRAMEGMGGKVVKRYRLYERRCWLEPARSGRLRSASHGGDSTPSLESAGEREF